MNFCFANSQRVEIRHAIDKTINFLSKNELEIE